MSRQNIPALPAYNIVALVGEGVMPCPLNWSQSPVVTTHYLKQMVSFSSNTLSKIKEVVLMAYGDFIESIAGLYIES